MTAPCGHLIAQPWVRATRIIGVCVEGHDFDLEHTPENHWGILSHFGVPSLRKNLHRTPRTVDVGIVRGVAE